MRTRGVLLIRDAIFVFGIYPSQRKLLMISLSGQGKISEIIVAARLKGWRTLCIKTIYQLQAHTDALQRHLEWFTAVGDTESSDVIRSNCISCLAYLANLYLTIAPTDHPTASTMESRCDAALSTLGSLTEGMVIEEYSHFDSLLGVSKPPRVRTPFSPPRCRCVGRERWKDSKLGRLPSRWNRPPRWYTIGR